MKTNIYIRRRLLLFLFSCLAFLFSFSQQVPKSLTAANGTFIGFLQYTPTDYSANPNTKYPLIIFLHGIGERGNGTTELGRVAANAIPRYINAGSPMRFYHNGEWKTFLVLSPQLANGMGYWPPFYVEEMIQYAKQNLQIDTNRIYLTGLSLGGGGVWQYATESVANSKQLAAIAPVCGTCNWSNMCNIAQANLPVWAFHASDDTQVGYGCTTGAISMLNSCGPTVAPLMTIYPNGNHYIWDRSYDTTHNWHNPNIYEWFLSNVRNSVPGPPNVPPIANAGPDQSIALPVNQATVNGSASSDPDGTISAYFWTKISGPAQYNITLPNSAITTITNLVQGTYQFSLAVTDNRGSTSRDTVSITVNQGLNQSPVAIASADIAMTLPVNAAPMDANASYDPDGGIASIQWTKISGPSQYVITSPTTSFTYVNSMVAGTYKFQLRVVDYFGAVGYDTVTMTVSSVPVPPNIPPVARAGSDQTITLPVNSVTLNGSASSDADGTITSYAWSKISGPSTYNIANPGSVSTAINNLVQGTYLFRLVVTDNSGANASDTVSIQVNPAPPPPNVAPVSNAGNDQVITLPANTGSLNGTASYDTDGSIISYAWTKISGPASYTIVNAAGSNTTVNNLVQGTYQFRLVVTDNSGASDDDTVSITVNAAPPPANIPPVANAGTDQSITLPTNTITLNGTGSTDADGTITNYLWTKISGPSSHTIVNSAGSSTAVNNLVQGTYQFRLVVTDNSGASDDDTVSITVNAAPPPPPTNIAPVAIAGPDQSITLPNSNVNLDGSASSDPDGNIISYLWTKISGPTSFNISNEYGASTIVNQLVQGTYLFRLVVTDNNGATDDDTVIVYVNSAPPPPNVAPVANAGADQSVTLPVNTATLNGSGSSDADGTITNYSWTKVSGPASYNIANANSASTAISNLVQGTYQFRLVVTDNNGATDDDTVSINVNAAPPPPNVAPVANAGADQSITLPSNSVTLNGSGSTDSDGTILAYGWTKISGPASFTIANSGSVSTVVNNLIEGTYRFQLTVTDDDGAQGFDTVTVTVNPKPNQPPVAKAGNDISLTLPTSTAMLNGLGSYDPDGSIVSYSWNRISGPAGLTIVNSTTASPTIVGLVEGDYIFQLTVTDNSGASSTDDVRISVMPILNQLPVASAGRDTTITVPNTAAWLNGSQSYDPDGNIIKFLWKQISGPASSIIANAGIPLTTANGLQPGDYEFELTVVDNDGAISKDSMKIAVVNYFRYEETLSINPNPVITSARIKIVSDSTGSMLLKISDINGNRVASYKVAKTQSSFERDFNLNKLKPGLYSLEAIIGTKRMVMKFIKQ